MCKLCNLHPQIYNSEMLIKYFVACSRYNKIQKMDYLLVNPMLNHKTQHIFKFLCYNNCKNYT